MPKKEGKEYNHVQETYPSQLVGRISRSGQPRSCQHISGPHLGGGGGGGGETTGDIAMQWRTLRAILGGGGGEIFNMYAFGVRLRYADLSNIMLLGISNSFFNYCNVTITLLCLYIGVFPCSSTLGAPKRYKL